MKPMRDAFARPDPVFHLGRLDGSIARGTWVPSAMTGPGLLRMLMGELAEARAAWLRAWAGRAYGVLGIV